MTVIHAVDNDLGLIVVRFVDRVTKEQVMNVIAGIAQTVTNSGTYRSLLIFEHSAALSDLDSSALQAIHTAAKDVYQSHKLQRQAGAAVVDASRDAKIIVPLWNALAAADPELDLHCEIYVDVEPALDWLKIPKDAGLAAAARTEQPAS